MKGKKFDDGKEMWHLLPLNIIKEVVQVLTFGATKYGENDWQEFISREGPNRYLSACFRHIEKWRSGEATDDETGFHHLAHAICCLIFILWREKECITKHN